MRPLLERLVSIRLPADKHEEYRLKAAQHGLALSEYLRLRLDVDDHVDERIAQLRLALLDEADAAEPPQSQAVLLELLLLARRRAAPADLRTVHSDLAAMGVVPWTPDSPGRPPD
ncbi:hypothetical protein [uncultured Pigmentiphaga sp.]|uniref:hypothetical protein n=1 Tax=uncultured Pigmentiphaga sp. TaxID=340361 RepID=UPI002635F065|nr:hypothetical protein [uncultured Pigmentiphaga sp.]